MTYVVIIGGIIVAWSLILAAVEYVSAREEVAVDKHRLMKEIDRHPPEPWAIHDKVTIVPKEDQ